MRPRLKQSSARGNGGGLAMMMRRPVFSSFSLEIPWTEKGLMHVRRHGWALVYGGPVLGVGVPYFRPHAGQKLSCPSGEQEPVLTSFNEEFHGLLASQVILGYHAWLSTLPRVSQRDSSPLNKSKTMET